MSVKEDTGNMITPISRASVEWIGPQDLRKRRFLVAAPGSIDWNDSQLCGVFN